MCQIAHDLVANAAAQTAASFVHRILLFSQRHQRAKMSTAKDAPDRHLQLKICFNTEETNTAFASA
jgi:hypothetical protein